MTTISLVEWLDLVDAAWTNCAPQCKNCALHTEPGRCEILHAARIPGEECPAVIASSGRKQPGPFGGYPRAVLEMPD